jgi:short-chain fatty acids transporter
MMTWHGGLSGSAPLKVTTQKDLIELLGPKLGAEVAPISLFETTFGGLNLWVTLGLLILVPGVAYLLAPKGDDPVVLAELPKTPDPTPEDSPVGSPPNPWPERVFRHPGTMLLLAIPLLGAAIQYIQKNGLGSLDPNALNLFMFLLGLLLHGNLRAYARAVEGAVGGCAGIMLQFPLYAGIMGIMTGTGLARVLAEWSAGASAPNVYLAQTFLGAALINMFVPSGGGQWAVQGPIAVEAARILGIPLSHAVMAVAYGDQWSNMLQPFWALPLLGITGVKAKDIIGYSATIMLVSGVWILGVIWWWV